MGNRFESEAAELMEEMALIENAKKQRSELEARFEKAAAEWTKEIALIETAQKQRSQQEIRFELDAAELTKEMALIETAKKQRSIIENRYEMEAAERMMENVQKDVERQIEKDLLEAELLIQAADDIKIPQIENLQKHTSLLEQFAMKPLGQILDPVSLNVVEKTSTY